MFLFCVFVGDYFKAKNCVFYNLMLFLNFSLIIKENATTSNIIYICICFKHIKYISFYHTDDVLYIATSVLC